MGQVPVNLFVPKLNNTKLVRRPNSDGTVPEMFVADITRYVRAAIFPIVGGTTPDSGFAQ